MNKKNNANKIGIAVVELSARDKGNDKRTKTNEGHYKSKTLDLKCTLTCHDVTNHPTYPDI